MRLNKKDILIILGAFVILLIVGVGLWFWIGEGALMVEIIVSSVLLVVLILEVHRRLIEVNRWLIDDMDEVKKHYPRIEALFSLFFTIKPQLPLPETGKWAASPDFLKKVVEVAYTNPPEIVVEVGSGISTLIIAYCLKQIGKGKVISLDHSAKYAARSQHLIASHGLDKFAAVVYAPLIDYEINGEMWRWYDTSFLQLDGPIDLLVIDGPPGTIGKLARYPAIPLLYKQLGDDVKIMLDDGARKDEKEVVERWRKEFQDLTHEFLNLEKGAFLLYKQRK
jgi:hypothetical protein